MDVLAGDEGPKHPVLASVLMGIIRALNDDSPGPSSSSDDSVTCRKHDRRQPPCRRRIHQKSSEVKTDKAQEYILPPADECLSPTEDPPIPEPIRSTTESPKLHTIVETEEEDKGEGSTEEGTLGSVEEKKVHTMDRDAIKHLQKESVRACSSTSSPLVTSDDSDIASFLSKHEYVTLFGAKNGDTDKILIPSRFVQDYGETSIPSKTNSSKRSSEDELNGAQNKKQKAHDTRVESPPKTPKRKLESLLDDTEQIFHQSIGNSEQDAAEVSVHDAISWDRDTGAHRSYETGLSLDSSGSTSQAKRLKTSDEELSKFSFGETVFSDSMSRDTMEESTGSSMLDDRQHEDLDRRKKKLSKTLQYLDPQDVDGLSDFSTDGQTETLKPSMTKTMPGPKIRHGNHGWTAGMKNVTGMIQKAASSSLEDFSDVLSPDLQLSTAYNDTGGKTDASATSSNGLISQVSKIASSNVSYIAASDPSEFDPSSKSSHLALSVGDISESKYKSEISETSFTSSEFKSVSSSVSSPKIETSNTPTEGTSKTTNKNANQEFISSMNESHSTATDLGHIESSILTEIEMSFEVGNVVTSSDKLYTDSTQSSKQKSVLKSSDVSSKDTSSSPPSSKENVTSTAALTGISYGSSLSRTTDLNESVDTFPSNSFASSLNAMSRSGASHSKQSSIATREKSEETATSPSTPTSVSFDSNDSSFSETTDLSGNTDASSSDSFVSSLNTTSRSGIDPRDLPAKLQTGTSQPLIDQLNDFYAPPMYSDATSNTSSNASNHLQNSSKTDGTLNVFQPSSDENTSNITSSAKSSTTRSIAVIASEATTWTGSPEEFGKRGSKPSSDVTSTSIASSSDEFSSMTANEATTLTESSSSESSNYSSDNTTRRSTYPSSSCKSIITSLGDEEDTTKDFTGDTYMPLSNINLTDALLRDDPSPSDFDDSDTPTSSSDEYLGLTHRLMQNAPSPRDRGFPRDHLALEGESADLPPTKLTPDDNAGAPIDVVEEDLFMKDVHGEYLPVLVEDEKEESSDDSCTQVDKENTNDIFAGDVEIGHIEETNTLHQPSPLVSSSEISTLSEDKTDNERADRLLIIDLDDNEKAFDHILITEDMSNSSLNFDHLPDYDNKPGNAVQLPASTSSDSEQTDIEHKTTNEYAVIEFSFEVANYVIVNAVATVFTDTIVNVAITRIMVEEDLAFQMERALFPGIDLDYGDEITHWISPARYRRENYSGSLGDTESLHKQTDIDDEREAFSLYLERAFFPCLADSDERSSNVLSSRSESSYHSLPEHTVFQTDETIKSTTPRDVITSAYSQVTAIASRASTIAVSSISQVWSIMTHLSSTIWNYIRDNYHVSKMRGKDEATQYDYTVTTVDNEASTSQIEMVEETDDARLNILASKIVTTAVTKAACRKEYGIYSEQSIPRETISYTSYDKGAASESEPGIVQLASSFVGDIFRRMLLKNLETRAVPLSTTPPNGMIIAAKKSEEEYKLRLSASTVVETAVSNALVIHDSIRESPSATPTVISTESEHMSVSSERSSIGDDVSACSLSDIPLSSITFIRQQLTDMRAIFQNTISVTNSDLGSTPALPPNSTTDAELPSSERVSSAVCLEAEQTSSAVGELVSRMEEETKIEETSVHSNELDESLTGSTLDSNDNTGELVLKDMTPSLGRQDKPSVADKEDDRINDSVNLLPGLSVSVRTDEESVNLNDTQESDSHSSSVSALSLSDVPLSGISYIREQLANVKILANSIMDDCNSYAEERTLVGEAVEPHEESKEVEPEIVDSALDSRQDKPSVADKEDDRINDSVNLLTGLSVSVRNDEESVNLNDTQESDSYSSSVSALSLSDVPISGISYIREQLANVKILANSIMDDCNSYAEERTLVAKRSSQLTCSSTLARSVSSCDSTRTIGNNSSNSLCPQGESKLGEIRKSSSDKESSLHHGNAYVPPNYVFQQEKGKVFQQVNEQLERANENGNAKTHSNDRVEQSDTKNERESKQLVQKAKDTVEMQAERDSELKHHLAGKTTKVADFESSHITDEADRTRTVQMTETNQMRQLAPFSRNSPSRQHVISRRKGADHPRGSYSGESTCSTDCSSSIVSTSSFSDATVSSEQSKKVIIESESQGKGRTDVSCRISDRGIWVNTSFLNEIDDDDKSMTADNKNAVEKCVKNKIQIKVKVSPNSRKKHHSHRVRSRGRDSQLHGAADHNQRALTILDNETLVKNREVKVNELSVKTRAEESRTSHIHAHDELRNGKDCKGQSNSSSFRHEVSDIHDHRAVELLNKVRPKKNSSLETQRSDMSEMIEEAIDLTASHIVRTKRECLSDGAVSEHRQGLNRKQVSMRRKSRETKPQESACQACEEKCAHPDDLLAAPVISRSERTRAVLSMLDDVADNLTLDSSTQEGKRKIYKKGNFLQLFASRKNKRRSSDQAPDRSPRVISDSSVSDCESGSPDYSPDSPRTPRSHSAASLLSNILRNLSSKRKRSKDAPSSTPNGSSARKVSVPAFDEMLGDFDDDCFIDDAFPKLVSIRDSPSEDNTSLNEVLQDLIEEWSFEGLEETLDLTSKSFGDRIREKLNLFMDEFRKEKRKVELRFGRDGS